MNVAVILAGGVGNRVGAGIPKQFIKVLGKPVIAYTIEQFNLHPEIDSILVVCVKPYLDYIMDIKEQYGFHKLTWVTEGGSTFQGSVMNGVDFLDGKINRDDIVLIHFGASPFITSDIITDSIRVCKEKGNAISTTDYYLLSGEKKLTTSVTDIQNYSEKYIDRDTVAVMNSPHAFQFGLISDMYKEATKTGIIDKIEPHTTTLMYAMGKKIFFSKGSQNNIKITRKEDLELFEGYVLEQQIKQNMIVKGDVVVLLADGFEECEALIVVDLLRRANIKTITASIMGRRDVNSSRGIMIRTDCLVEDFEFDSAKMMFLPGGRIGTENLRQSEFVKSKCLKYAETKIIAAICAAPSILAELGLLNGKEATCHPDYENQMEGAIINHKSVAISGNIITGQGLGSSFEFAFEMISAFRGEDESKRIKKMICCV